MAYFIVSNTERYVSFNFLNSLNNEYLDKLKNFALLKKRFMTLEEYGEKSFIDTKWQEHTEKFINHDKKSKELDEWCEKNYPQYTRKNIKTIKNLNELSFMFYNDDIWGIHGHPGPLNYESKYILNELKNFTKTNFVAIDSEPGFLFDNHLQLPYITLFSTHNNFQKLFESMQYSYIGIVDYPINSSMNNIYNFENNDENYCEYTFGIDLKYILCQSDFEKFILTNKFFEDILHMINNLK
jgi:hypothetical protein